MIVRRHRRCHGRSECGTSTLEFAIVLVTVLFPTLIVIYDYARVFNASVAVKASADAVGFYCLSYWSNNGEKFPPDIDNSAKTVAFDLANTFVPLAANRLADKNYQITVSCLYDCSEAEPADYDSWINNPGNLSPWPCSTALTACASPKKQRLAVRVDASAEFQMAVDLLGIGVITINPPTYVRIK